MSDLKHTHQPTPWLLPRIDGANSSVLVDDFRIEVADARGAVVLDVITTYEARAAPDELANAEFLVRACNSYDDLLGACKAALPFVKDNDLDGDVYDLLRAAIAKTETSK